MTINVTTAHYDVTGIYVNVNMRFIVPHY